VQMAALVRGTDDEHPHVLIAGGIQGGTVVLADEIPVQVDVVEGTAVAAGGDQVRGAMGGEAHMTDPPFGLPAPNDVHAATGPQGLLKVLRQIDAMDCQKIEAIALEPLKGQLELSLEGLRILSGRHLALQEPCCIAAPGQRPAQLPFGTAVMTGGFDVMKAALNSPLECGLKVAL